MPKTPEETLPKVSPSSTSEDMMTINVDPQETDGGIRVNGELFLGEHTLPRSFARQILEIARQYKETKNKMFDPNTKIQEKNMLNIEKWYLDEDSFKKGNREFGSLDPWQWQWIPESEKERLRDLKFRMFGYKAQL